MKVIPSGKFIADFTLVADTACTEKERYIVQRPSGANLVVMSMADYNEIMQELYKNREKVSE